MPWFLPALTATATAALVRKIVARYWHGVAAEYAHEDPAGVRTVARFATDDPEHVMRTIAASLAREIEGIEVTNDALRTTDAEIVRLRREPALLVELTRAWTGVYLGDQARHTLHRIDVALRSSAREIAWFARQDRALAAPFARPFDEQALAAR